MNERYPAGRRDEFATTFDRAAELYDKVRPRYPIELFDALTTLSSAAATSRVLEVGPATGIATRELANRFGQVVGVEPGAALATAARQSLRDRPNVEIAVSTFEHWTPERWHSFDLVVAATSWHWVDPAVRYQRAHQHLTSGGTLAFWSALHVAGRDPFFDQAQDLYESLGTGKPAFAGLPQPGDLPDHSVEIDHSGLFTTLGVRQFDWEVSYTADQYIGLLRSFSSHIAMAEQERTWLFGELRQRIEARENRVVHRHWGAALHVARSL